MRVDSCTPGARLAPINMQVNGTMLLNTNNTLHFGWVNSTCSRQQDNHISSAFFPRITTNITLMSLDMKMWKRTHPVYERWNVSPPISIKCCSLSSLWPQFDPCKHIKIVQNVLIKVPLCSMVPVEALRTKPYNILLKWI